MSKSYRDIPVPRPRGFQPTSIEFKIQEANLIWAKPVEISDCPRDVVIHALVARVAYKDDSTEEFLTTYDKDTNLLEIDIPQDKLDRLTSIEIGPKVQQYFAWLMSGFLNLRRSIKHFTMGSGGVLTPGIKGLGFEVDASAVIERVDVFADLTGSVTIDVLKTDFAGYPATSADSITNGDYLTISSNLKAKKEDLSNWEVRVERGDLLQFEILSNTAANLITVAVHFLYDNVMPNDSGC